SARSGPRTPRCGTHLNCVVQWYLRRAQTIGLGAGKNFQNGAARAGRDTVVTRWRPAILVARVSSRQACVGARRAGWRMDFRWSRFRQGPILSRQHGQIAVRITHKGARSFRLEVEDTGIGIGPAEIPLLFQRFAQLPVIRKAVQGTELGLTLTRHLVEA